MSCWCASLPPVCLVKWTTGFSRGNFASVWVKGGFTHGQLSCGCEWASLSLKGCPVSHRMQALMTFGKKKLYHSIHFGNIKSLGYMLRCHNNLVRQHEWMCSHLFTRVANWFWMEHLQETHGWHKNWLTLWNVAPKRPFHFFEWLIPSKEHNICLHTLIWTEVCFYIYVESKNGTTLFLFTFRKNILFLKLNIFFGVSLD